MTLLLGSGRLQAARYALSLSAIVFASLALVTAGQAPAAAPFTADQASREGKSGSLGLILALVLMG